MLKKWTFLYKHLWIEEQACTLKRLGQIISLILKVRDNVWLWCNIMVTRPCTKLYYKQSNPFLIKDQINLTVAQLDIFHTHFCPQCILYKPLRILLITCLWFLVIHMCGLSCEPLRQRQLQKKFWIGGWKGEKYGISSCRRATIAKNNPDLSIVQSKQLGKSTSLVSPQTQSS